MTFKEKHNFFMINTFIELEKKVCICFSKYCYTFVVISVIPEVAGVLCAVDIVGFLGCHLICSNWVLFIFIRLFYF